MQKAPDGEEEYHALFEFDGSKALLELSELVGGFVGGVDVSAGGFVGKEA